MRAAMNAILYLLHTGCPWRYLPRDSPPRSTVYNIFRKFQRDGVSEAIWAELHMAWRECGPSARAGSRIDVVVRATARWIIRTHPAGLHMRPPSRSEPLPGCWCTRIGCASRLRAPNSGSEGGSPTPLIPGCGR